MGYSKTCPCINCICKALCISKEPYDTISECILLEDWILKSPNFKLQKSRTKRGVISFLGRGYKTLATDDICKIFLKDLSNDDMEWVFNRKTKIKFATMKWHLTVSDDKSVVVDDMKTWFKKEK